MNKRFPNGLTLCLCTLLIFSQCGYTASYASHAATTFELPCRLGGEYFNFLWFGFFIIGLIADIFLGYIVFRFFRQKLKLKMRIEIPVVLLYSIGCLLFSSISLLYKQRPEHCTFDFSKDGNHIKIIKKDWGLAPYRDADEQILNQIETDCRFRSGRVLQLAELVQSKISQKNGYPTAVFDPTVDAPHKLRIVQSGDGKSGRDANRLISYCKVP